jgi:hypothetical protein
VNSSASASAICREEARSSDIHGAEPTCNREAARSDAISVDQNNVIRVGCSATVFEICNSWGYRHIAMMQF